MVDERDRDRPTVRLCGPVCPSSVFSPTTVTVSYKFESRQIVGQRFDVQFGINAGQTR